jgi:hypothetical protein
VEEDQVSSEEIDSWTQATGGTPSRTQINVICYHLLFKRKMTVLARKGAQ